MLPWHLLLLMFCFSAHFVFIYLMLHQLSCILDLEFDNILPSEATTIINKWIIPEYALQAAICILFLLGREWIMFLVAFPLTCFHALRYLKRLHLVDEIEIFRVASFEKSFRVFKLGLYIFFFATSMIRLMPIAFNFLITESDRIGIF